MEGGKGPGSRRSHPRGRGGSYELVKVLEVLGGELAGGRRGRLPLHEAAVCRPKPGQQWQRETKFKEKDSADQAAE